MKAQQPFSLVEVSTDTTIRFNHQRLRSNSSKSRAGHTKARKQLLSNEHPTSRLRNFSRSCARRSTNLSSPTQIQSTSGTSQTRKSIQTESAGSSGGLHCSEPTEPSAPRPSKSCGDPSISSSTPRRQPAPRPYVHHSPDRHQKRPHAGDHIL